MKFKILLSSKNADESEFTLIGPVGPSLYQTWLNEGNVGSFNDYKLSLSTGMSLAPDITDFIASLDNALYITPPSGNGGEGYIELTNVSISSDNLLSQEIAEVGDTITLNITASETILPPDVTFQSGGLNVNDIPINISYIPDNNWLAEYVVSESDNYGSITFSLNYKSINNMAQPIVSTADGSVYFVKLITRSEILQAISDGSYTVNNIHFTDPAFSTLLITDMSSLFLNNSFFNEDISNWDTSNVIDMARMFYQCTNLTSVNLQNTGAVTDMSRMFQQCDNLIIVNLGDTSAVTDMISMFYQCTNLTSVNLQNTGAVTDMRFMFMSASNLNQDFSNLDISSVTDMSAMFSYSGMSPENYAKTLIGWANRAYNNGSNDGVQSNVFLGASLITYSTSTYNSAPSGFSVQFNDAVSAKNYLVNTFGWTVMDAGG